MRKRQSRNGEAKQINAGEPLKRRRIGAEKITRRKERAQNSANYACENMRFFYDMMQEQKLIEYYYGNNNETKEITINTQQWLAADKLRLKTIVNFKGRTGNNSDVYDAWPCCPWRYIDRFIYVKYPVHL